MMRWCDREAAAAVGGHVANGAVRGSLKRQQGGKRESRVETYPGLGGRKWDEHRAETGKKSRGLRLRVGQSDSHWV